MNIPLGVPCSWQRWNTPSAIKSFVEYIHHAIFRTGAHIYRIHWDDLQKIDEKYMEKTNPVCAVYDAENVVWRVKDADTVAPGCEIQLEEEPQTPVRARKPAVCPDAPRRRHTPVTRNPTAALLSTLILTSPFALNEEIHTAVAEMAAGTDRGGANRIVIKTPVHAGDMFLIIYNMVDDLWEVSVVEDQSSRWGEQRDEVLSAFHIFIREDNLCNARLVYDAMSKDEKKMIPSAVRQLITK